jgi:type IV pilus assembly protein PilY1
MDHVIPKVISKRGFTVSAFKRLLTLKGVGGRMIYRIKQYSWILIVFAIVINLSVSEIRADDTCMFSVTADEVPPNIVLLLDNGAEMQQVQWLPGYDNDVDYTPTPAENDVVKTGGSGSGFLNPNGYGMVEHGGYYYLVEIKDDLEPEDYTQGLQATSSDSGNGTGVWTINANPVTLPAEASDAVDADGIIDNAGMLRYSQNYLNWIVFSGLYTGVLDLERRSRFYNAKKAILNVAKLASNLAYFGIYNFTNYEGASSVQPLSMVVDTVNTPATSNVLDPAFVNNVNNMGTFTYSPLAEGLATIGGLYDSPSSATFTEWVETYCQKNFVIVVSPGLSSMDRHGANQYLPETLEDYDGDGGGIGEGNIIADSDSYIIPTNYNGSTWLDDVAHYMYTHDMVGYQVGFQNVTTYTVGFMGDLESNLFLINASNNGNGNLNLYDTNHPEYGKYHFTAESPDDLTSVLLDAVNSILSQNMTYTSPVVPVTKTMSGNRLYLAFFKPLDENFWEGNIVKLGINENHEVVDKNGNLATWPNGAMRDDIKYYWSTKDWADTSATNGISNASRNIYTYLGGDRNLITDGPEYSNAFKSSNTGLTEDPAVLGNPTHSTAQIIDYVRGADVFDEDADEIMTENRAVITGDVLHSQPLVVQYVYSGGQAISMVFFGSNDGMLHAVLDSIDPDIENPDDAITQYGTEAWAFISPDHLSRLKDIVEGSAHQYFIDSSPQVYIKDVNENGILENTVDSDGDGDVDDDDIDRVILVCGQRKGGTSYFALDVTVPVHPVFLWRISADNSFSPDWVVSELGESWSEPRFGQVKTSDTDTVGTAVFFIGGGFSSDNSAGKAVMAIDVFSGEVVKTFVKDDSNNTDMNYSIPSNVNLIDEDGNGFVDKVYVGDLGGQMWRIGQFDHDSTATPLVFPYSDENIHSWNGHVLFRAPTYVYNSVTTPRKFYYPPSVTLEKGYDLIFMGTGDRDLACENDTAADRIYSMKDTHAYVTLTEADLVDVTNTATIPPDMDIPGDVDGNDVTDKGWYIRLVDSDGAETGEKILAKGTVFYKTLYITSFTPSDDPCLPGGEATIYALDYKTGAAVLALNGSGLERSMMLGGGVPSTPVPIITSHGQKLLVSVGSTIPVAGSDSVEAGIIGIDPLAPGLNFYYMWWREL